MSAMPLISKAGEQCTAHQTQTIANILLYDLLTSRCTQLELITGHFSSTGYKDMLYLYKYHDNNKL